jgi:hypothetical protein
MYYAKALSFQIFSKLSPFLLFPISLSIRDKMTFFRGINWKEAQEEEEEEAFFSDC